MVCTSHPDTELFPFLEIGNISANCVPLSGVNNPGCIGAMEKRGGGIGNGMGDLLAEDFCLGWIRDLRVQTCSEQVGEDASTSAMTWGI